MMGPPSISGRSAWGLEELESIVVFHEVDSDQTAVVYQTSIANYKTQSRVLYSARHLQRHSPEATNTPYREVGLQLFGRLWTR